MKSVGRSGSAIVVLVALAALSGSCGDEPEPVPAPEPVPRVDLSRLPPTPEGPAGLKPVFERLPAFTYPVEMLQAPGDSGYWYVTEQVGRLRRFRNDPQVDRAPVLLDISERIVGPEQDWESGVIGMAFHPQFQRNRQLFLFYSTPSDQSPVKTRVVLSRFSMPDGSDAVDPGSEEELLTIQCQHLSYNGGTMRFGPDGFLYVSSGRNTASESRPHPSQDPGRLEGKILRIDVDSGDPYGIPPDNPFVNGGGAPEVFAYGFRNPWKISFDRETGRLFAGDVGHIGFEEINLVESGRNYGWAEIEGDTCQSDCPPNYEPPIHAYPGPGVAVIAGEVYRGPDIEELQGAFIFADFMRAEVWALHPDGAGWRPARLMKTGKSLRKKRMVGSITSFASDPEGHLFALTRGGRIVELVTREEMSRYYAALMASSDPAP